MPSHQKAKAESSNAIVPSAIRTVIPSHAPPIPAHPCSLQTYTGYLHVYPKRSDVHFLSGSEKRLKDYYMGLKLKPHRFCPECSSNILIDFQHGFPEQSRHLLAVNVRMFDDDVDLVGAKYDFFDGKNFDGKNLPEPSWEEQAALWLRAREGTVTEYFILFGVVLLTLAVVCLLIAFLVLVILGFFALIIWLLKYGCSTTWISMPRNICNAMGRH